MLGVVSGLFAGASPVVRAASSMTGGGPQAEPCNAGGYEGEWDEETERLSTKSSPGEDHHDREDERVEGGTGFQWFPFGHVQTLT